MKAINATLNTANGKVKFTINGSKENNAFVSDQDFSNLKTLSMSNYDQEDGSQDVDLSFEDFDIKDGVVLFKNLSARVEDFINEGEF